jgi:high-affinity Fe2+/Pb2+ permease
MPVTPWSNEKYGLGLWNSVGGTVAVELVMFFGGLAIYLSQTRARDKTGQIALWSLVVLLVVIWVSATFGPPPPSLNALQYSGLALWLTVAWGYWIDRHRELARGGSSENIG